MFDYTQRAGTKDYRKGYDQTFSYNACKCPHCNSFVSKDDRSCWLCKKEISNAERG